MRYELVYAQAQNKAYVNFTTDSIVLSLVDYYGRHGNANEQMMANYMAGCAYRDLEDALSALKYLNLAVDAVDESDEDCDLNILKKLGSVIPPFCASTFPFLLDHPYQHTDGMLFLPTARPIK